MPPVLKQANGSFIVREDGPIPVPIILESQVSDLRAYETRLRAMKATRTGSVTKYKSAAAQQKMVRKVYQIKARKAREEREKESENTIRNLLSKGLQPSEIRRLFASLGEVDRNSAMWKYINTHVVVRND